MNLFQLVTGIGLTGNLFLGFFVLLSNPRRSANIGFLILSLMAALWLTAMLICSFPANEIQLIFWVRQTTAFASMIPFGFFLVQEAIIHPRLSLWRIAYNQRFWLAACVIMLAISYAPFFVLKATSPTETELVPPTEYGWGFFVYVTFFVAVLLRMMWGGIIASKSSQGSTQVELQFLQMGFAFGVLAGIVIYVLAELLDNQELSLFVPLSALVLDGFVAYGIATRRILAASEVLQRVISYMLVVLYLTIVYFLAAWGAHQIFRWFVENTVYLSGLAAALVVAFSVSPAQNWMHRFSYRLFSSSNPFDMNRVLNESEAIFQEVSTETSLLAAFSDFITHIFRTTRVVLLEKNANDSFSERCSFPERGKDEQVSLKSHSSLIELVNRDRESFTEDTLNRMRSTLLIIKARREINQIGAAVVIGCFLHKKLQMIVLLHPKTNGAIYDLREQQALQRLCNQLAVALENARLYTAVQDGKIYNEILLDSLTSGIIAINESRKVTVFNQRAQTITQFSDKDIINESIDKLPSALAELADNILTSGFGVRDVDLFIELPSSKVPIRVSGSVFHSYKGVKLGVLLVFSDMTLLRKMEEQIRLSDRLSSIGTLSAGMAHEIKNPLVTIRTFTELLPEQHNNPDFRDTFFDLVSQEVQRIDSIVNRLLHFARPAKASLKLTHLHDVIENSILLIEQQLSKSRIKLEKTLSAEHDLVMADSEQINQALINFFLNAIQAMEPGGLLSVKTSQSDSTFYINVGDTGCGLSEEQKKCIFDPFFTTKETGVGLGLSISHGIIQEHQGKIIVESKKGEGTTFHVELPLAKEKEI